MRSPGGLVVICFGCALVWMGSARAQFGRGGDWMTSNNDAQRTSWVRTDAMISKDNMLKPGFQFLWKLKLDNDARQLNSLTQPVLVGNIIGYKGFKSLAIVGGSSDNVYAIDYDLGRIEWKTHLDYSAATPPPRATLDCPGGLTANLTRPTTVFATAAGGRGGRGRGRLGGAVGEPGQGAANLAETAAARGGPAAGGRGGPAPGGPGGRGGRGGGGGGGGFGGPGAVFAVSSDGRLHSLNLQNGAAVSPPVPFLPPNAKAYGLILVDNVLYTATGQDCGGVANGAWAIDLATRTITTWKSNGGGIWGSAGPTFGTDGTLYVATGDGDYSPASYSNTVVALDATTLKLKDYFTPAKLDFNASPVVFQYKGKDVVVVSSKDGRLYLLDSASLGGPDHRTPLYRTPRYSTGNADFMAGALASWEEADGTRWVLAPSGGPVHSETKFPVAYGSANHGAIVAYKVAEQNGKPVLQPGWVSRDMNSPLPPIVINGVVFAVSSGEYRTNDPQMSAAERARRSVSAVLYALDATTGKELWSSGGTITWFVRSGGLSGGAGQVYVGTHDSTLYAFGFPMEH